MSLGLLGGASCAWRRVIGIGGVGRSGASTGSTGHKVGLYARNLAPSGAEGPLPRAYPLLGRRREQSSVTSES